MPLLVILLSLFAFLGFGSGSSGTVTSATSSATTAVQSSQRVAGCVVVTWKAGQPAHQRPCHKAPAKP